MRNAGPWIAFFLLTPMILYVLLGGIAHGIEQHENKVSACEQAGGVMTRDMQCVKRVDIEPLDF